MKSNKLILHLILIWFTAAIVVTSADAQEVSSKETLDMSQISASIRDKVGMESVLQLKEILDRLVFPLIDSVPNLKW